MHRSGRTTLAVTMLHLVLLLAGCSQALQGSPSQVSLASLRESPDAFAGQKMALGGTIVAMHPRENGTDLEVQALPIGRDGQPQRGAPSSGRFIARTGQALDPTLYAPGRSVTVVGQLTPMDHWAFGDATYTFLVITYDDLLLWPPNTTAGGVVVGRNYWVWPYTFWRSPAPYVPLVVVW
jgi:outer membrane lipoprotein